MALIDSLQFHEESDAIQTEEEFDNASIVMGLYLRWLVSRNLMSESFMEDNNKAVDDFESRRTSSAEFCLHTIGGKLYQSELSLDGQEFTKEYYLKGVFFDDLADVFSEFDSLYQIADTRESFEKICERLDDRYKVWTDAQG